MAYLLIELCHHTHGPVVNRAWAVLDVVFGDSNGDGNEGTAVLAGISIEKSALWRPLQNLLKRARHVRKQVALQPEFQQGQTSDCELPSLNFQYTEGNVLPVEEHILVNRLPNEKILFGDPFFDSVPADFAGEDWTWEGLDSLVQGFQTDLFRQQEGMEYHDNNPAGTLNWW